MENEYTDSRQVNREAMLLSASEKEWYFVRKPDRHVERYLLVRGKANALPGDRAYFVGRAMPF